MTNRWSCCITTNTELIIISESQCETLDSTWSNVVTDPTLPVEHGWEITLNCLANHVNKGGNKATCLYGEIFLHTTSPQCSSISMCLISFKYWVIVGILNCDTYLYNQKFQLILLYALNCEEHKEYKVNRPRWH